MLSFDVYLQLWELYVSRSIVFVEQIAIACYNTAWADLECALAPFGHIWKVLKWFSDEPYWRAISLERIVFVVCCSFRSNENVILVY